MTSTDSDERLSQMIRLKKEVIVMSTIQQFSAHSVQIPVEVSGANRGESATIF
jgi:hypothetical protein